MLARTPELLAVGNGFLGSYFIQHLSFKLCQFSFAYKPADAIVLRYIIISSTNYREHAYTVDESK